MTRPEDLLSDALRDRVDRRDLPPTPMGDVVSTARRIQRRRRLRTAAVTAAVVAVLATPFVVAATHGSDSTTGPTDPSSTDSDPLARLADVALGQPPAVAWLDGSDYVAADGTRTTLPLDDVTRATTYGGGFLVTDRDDDVILLDSNLNEVWRRCTLGGFAVSNDGLRTAYTTGGCAGSDPRLHLGLTSGAGDEQAWPMPPAPAWPVGVLGNTVVTSSYNEGSPALIDGVGAASTLDQLSYAADVDERLGLVSGQLSGGAVPRTTGAVVDASTGSVRWRAVGWNLWSFSPDGSMVVGAHIGGGDSQEWAVFDAETGARLHEFATPAGFKFARVVWEDDEHLLATTLQGRIQAILRTTLDGAIQRASDTAPYDDGDGLRFGLGPNDFP
jgi:hypothetical protein